MKAVVTYAESVQSRWSPAESANPAECNVAEEIKGLTDGMGCCVYIEASQSPKSAAQGMNVLSNYGRYVQMAVLSDLVTADCCFQKMIKKACTPLLIYVKISACKNYGGKIMSRGTVGKNNWALFLLLLAGIVLGGFIGSLADGVSFLSWLNYGQSFGFTSPIVLDLGILVITFGLNMKITIASIIGVLISIIIYRLL